MDLSSVLNDAIRNSGRCVRIGGGCLHDNLGVDSRKLLHGTWLWWFPHISSGSIFFMWTILVFGSNLSMSHSTLVLVGRSLGCKPTSKLVYFPYFQVLQTIIPILQHASILVDIHLFCFVEPFSSSISRWMMFFMHFLCYMDMIHDVLINFTHICRMSSSVLYIMFTVLELMYTSHVHIYIYKLEVFISTCP